jgi:hypothetical protein
MTTQSENSGSEPIGVNITPLIEQQMALTQVSNLPLLECFGSSALQVAIAQHEIHGRGMVLGLQSPRSKKFLYIKQADSHTALWMTAVEMKRKVAETLSQYSPQENAVIVMVTPPRVQLYLADQTKSMKMLEIQEVQQTTMKLPQGVSFQREQKGQTFYYVYTHNTLGSLGRIVLNPVTPSMMSITHEIIAPKGFESPKLQQQRLSVFLPLAAELISRLELGLMR